MPKLSLKAIMAVVAIVALGFCGLRDPTPFWESTVFTVAFLALVAGLLTFIGADPGHRRRRAGYCVVGWLYWLSYFGPSWVQGNVGPFLLTDHLVKEMTAEFRSPKLEAQMKSMQKAIQYYENDAMTAYAELEAIKRGGGMIQDDPALLKAEELAKAARRIVDFKSRHEVLLSSGGLGLATSQVSSGPRHSRGCSTVCSRSWRPRRVGSSLAGWSVDIARRNESQRSG